MSKIDKIVNIIKAANIPIYGYSDHIAYTSFILIKNKKMIQIDVNKYQTAAEEKSIDDIVTEISKKYIYEGNYNYV